MTVLSGSIFADGESYALFTSVDQDNTKRLSAYKEYWNFYKGKHWTHVRDINAPVVTVNKSRRFIDILSGWLFKRGFEIYIPDDLKTEETDAMDRDFISRALNDTWEKNKKIQWGLEAGQMGGVTGDLFMRVSWDEDDPLDDPHTRVDILPSHYVFPEFGGPHGVDRKYMTRCTILYPKYVYETKGLIRRRRSRKTVVDGEIWTKETYQTIREDNIVATNPNPYGEIPIVHVPNVVLAGEFFGVSDLADLIDLNKEYNEKCTDISDVIAYHGSPLTIAKGCRLKDLNRGANNVIAIPEKADVKNLELSGDLKAALSYVELIERHMHEISGVPREAMGHFTNVANTAAAAIALRFMPLTDRRDMKIATYGTGIRFVNRLIIKTLRLKDVQFDSQFRQLENKSPKGANLYRTAVKFNEPMPRDETLELNKAQLRIEIGLSSKQDEMRDVLGLSKAEIEERIENMKQEAQDFANNEYNAPILTKKKPVPSGPVRDEKRSAAALKLTEAGQKVTQASDMINR